jgi:hypothetical protein
MRELTPGFRVVSVSLGICALCAGLVLFGTGCPVVDGCTANADCDDGLYCNGAETCTNGLCAAGTAPCAEGEECVEASDSCTSAAGCETDADCEEGEFCDAETGECTVNVNVYAVTKVDADYAERVHYDFEESIHTSCAACHHAADTEAGLPDASNTGCETCHSDDPNQPNSFKDIAHDANESGDGCRMCHDAEFTGNCAFCHPDAP